MRTTHDWNSYLERTMSDIGKSAASLLAVGELFQSWSGKTLSDALKDPFLKAATLGGLQSNKSFSENAFAGFCKDLYGLRFDFEKLTALLNRRNMEDAAQEIELSWSRTSFLEGVSNVHASAQALAHLGDYNIERAASYPTQPEQLTELATQFINLCKQISPNYDEYMQFLFCTRCVSRKYLKVQYPYTSSEVLTYLGLQDRFTPSEPHISNDYALLGYENGSLGKSCLDLLNSTLALLNVWDLRSWFDIENELEKYVERSVGRLVPCITPHVRTVFRWVTQTAYAKEKSNSLRIGLDRTVGVPYPWRAFSFPLEIADSGTLKHVRGTILIEDLVDALSPQMSLGLAFIENTGGHLNVNGVYQDEQ